MHKKVSILHMPEKKEKKTNLFPVLCPVQQNLLYLKKKKKRTLFISFCDLFPFLWEKILPMFRSVYELMLDLKLLLITILAFINFTYKLYDFYIIKLSRKAL